MPTLEALRFEFDEHLHRIHMGIADRIGEGILHHAFGEEFTLPNESYFRELSDPVFEAFADMTRYDMSKNRQPAPTMIFLPPAALVDGDKHATGPHEESIENPEASGRPILRPEAKRFLNAFSGSSTKVVDEAGLVRGISDRWELAVVQGDWSESGDHTHYDPDNPGAEELPEMLQRMIDVAPIGYVALGGSVDRMERHATWLDTGNPQQPAYGAYKRRLSGAGVHWPVHGAVSGEDANDSRRAQILILPQRPRAKYSLMSPAKELPLKRRLMYHSGLAD